MNKWCHCARIKRDNVLNSTRFICIPYIVASMAKLQTVGLFGFSTNVALISTSFHPAFLLEAVTLWDSRFLILSGFYLWLQDLDSGHPWTCLIVRRRTAALEPEISPRFSHNGYLLSGQISQCVASRSGVNTGCVPFRSKRVCVGSLERLKWLNVA